MLGPCENRVLLGCSVKVSSATPQAWRAYLSQYASRSRQRHRQLIWRSGPHQQWRAQVPSLLRCQCCSAGLRRQWSFQPQIGHRDGKHGITVELRMNGPDRPCHPVMCHFSYFFQLSFAAGLRWSRSNPRWCWFQQPVLLQCSRVLYQRLSHTDQHRLPGSRRRQYC